MSVPLDPVVGAARRRKATRSAVAPPDDPGPNDPLAASASASAVDAEHRRILAELYEDHYRSLVRLACLLVDRTEVAEEVVQEAFVRMFGALEQVRDPDARPAYLRSIVMNLARGHLRRRRVTQKHDTVGQQVASGADVGAAVREDQLEVIRALRALPTRQRECLVLRFYGECTEAEIAATLGISQGAVKSHLSRGRRAMVRLLEGQR